MQNKTTVYVKRKVARSRWHRCRREQKEDRQTNIHTHTNWAERIKRLPPRQAGDKVTHTNTNRHTSSIAKSKQRQRQCWRENSVALHFAFHSPPPPLHWQTSDRQGSVNENWMGKREHLQRQQQCVCVCLRVRQKRVVHRVCQTVLCDTSRQ